MKIKFEWRLIDTYSSMSLKFAKVEKWAIYGHAKNISGSKLLFKRALCLFPKKTRRETPPIGNYLLWPINVISIVDYTKLPYYALPPTQHHSFFRNLPQLLICMTVNFLHHMPENNICLKTTLGDWTQNLWTTDELAYRAGVILASECSVFS